MQVGVKKGDVIWSYLSVITTFVASVITLPIIIYYLDGDMLGLWYVFSSLGSITILFDFGFTVTFSRSITYCWSGAKKLTKIGVSDSVSSETDFEMMRNILYTCKRIYLIIALTAFVLLISVGTYYIFYISREISGYTHILSWLIYAIGAFLNLYYNYFDSFLRGVGAVKQANQNRVYARVAQLVVMLILLMSGLGLLGLSIAYLVFGVVFRVLGRSSFYSYQNIGEQLKKVQTPIQKSVFKEMFLTIWFNAWRDGVVSLSIYLSGQATVLLCSLYLSLTETGIYSIGMQIANVVAMLSSALYVTYQPSIQSNWVRGDIREVSRIMSLIVKVFIFSFIAGAIVVTTLGIPILKYIKPDVIIEIPILIGLFISQFMIRYRDCYTSFFSCTNRLIYMPAFLISSILCIVFSVVLLKYYGMGMWGLVIAQIISQGLFNVWYWPLKAKIELKNSAIVKANEERT